ncbi:MAG: chloride channel protein [Spirochaetes bacterium]|nr:chloride channel protein [Spirochaetota bacterium]
MKIWILGKPKKLFARFRLPTELYRYITYVFFSTLLGLLAGLGAVLFHYLLDLSRNFFEEGNFADMLNVDARLIVLVPVIGAMTTASMTRFFPETAKQKGVTSVIKSVLIHNGFIPLRVTIFHLIAPLVSIGTGAPLGPEGPAAKIGSGLGSWMCQVLRLSQSEMKMYAAAGAGAAISAVFNAPIAGVFFSIEIILLNDIKNRILGGFIIAAVVANLISRAILGDTSVFNIPPYHFPALEDYPIFLLLGIVCGAVSLLYFLISNFSAHLVRTRLKIKNGFILILPLSLIFGFVLLRYPELFGVGYGAMNGVINGNYDITLVATLLALKIVFVALFLRSGAYGGLFAPALYIGVFTGFLFSWVIDALFGIATDPVLFSLVAMGGVLAGIHSIPLTSMMLVFELTNDYRLILPLMLVSVIAYLVVIYVNNGSLYTRELREDGINVAIYGESTLLSKIRVRDIMRVDFESVYTTTPLRKILPLLGDSGCNDIFVVDKQNALSGVISIRDIRHVLLSSDMTDVLLAMDISAPAPILTDADTVAEALGRIEEYDIENIPVVDSHESKVVMGMITRHDILKAYNRLLERGDRINL